MAEYAMPAVAQTANETNTFGRGPRAPLDYAYYVIGCQVLRVMTELVHHNDQQSYVPDQNLAINYAIAPNDMTAVVSIEDMVKSIQVIFGLNALQVARLVGVSRASLYNHMKINPPKELEKYSQLYQAAIAVRQRLPNGVGKGLKSVVVDGKTLLEHLKADYSEPNRLAELAVRVHEKLIANAEAPRTLSIEERRARTHAQTLQG